jgi:hypothetical protein
LLALKAQRVMAMVDLVVIAEQDQGAAERRRNLDLAHMSAESAQGSSKERLK